MLQSGIATRDLDVRWVSSLSWYFLNLFGLQPVFIFILGNDNGNPPLTSLSSPSLPSHQTLPPFPPLPSPLSPYPSLTKTPPSLSNLQQHHKWPNKCPK